MMKLLQHHFILIIAAITLSSCFDVKEEIIFNTDGSGTYQQTQDYSAMQSTFSLDSLLGPKTIKANETISKWLKNIPGIHNVHLNYKKEGINTIGFEFTSVAALNNALKNSGTYPTYVWNKKTFKYNGGIAQFGDSIKPLGTLDEAAMFSVCKYVYSVQLPTKKIKNCSNTGARYIYNTITFETTLDKLVENDKFASMIVKYK